ncbi:2TM domain-containing protein [Methanogenium sp. S4BF]|uniref:2TM domain-containing protein n=1 Tax=Methanogenium sp. S4BF TaxID=1789226 RepID=UPI002416E044|nr:2TM domain-containing protein [Methanogenium sp. S4BF]WFN34661.1 2TM domain-containing protein [Methanogenium sp. S4BF]
MPDIRGFYIHFGIYILINIPLFTVNAVTAWGNRWFYRVTLFRGVSIAMHAA